MLMLPVMIAAVAGFAVGAHSTAALAAAVAPGRTDQLLERLIAQDMVNASLLTELLQLLRQAATAQPVPRGVDDNVGGAVGLNPRINGQKGAGVKWGCSWHGALSLNHDHAFPWPTWPCLINSTQGAVET